MTEINVVDPITFLPDPDPRIRFWLSRIRIRVTQKDRIRPTDCVYYCWCCIAGVWVRRCEGRMEPTSGLDGDITRDIYIEHKIYNTKETHFKCVPISSYRFFWVWSKQSSLSGVGERKEGLEWRSYRAILTLCVVYILPQQKYTICVKSWVEHLSFLYSLNKIRNGSYWQSAQLRRVRHIMLLNWLIDWLIDGLID